MRPAKTRQRSRLNLRVPAELLDRIERAAAEEGARRGQPVGVSQFVREVLELRLRRQERARRRQVLEDQGLAEAMDEAAADPANRERIPLERLKGKLGL